MQLLTSIFFPFLIFARMKRPIEAVITLFLQLTIIGWLLASYLAYKAHSQFVIEKRIAKVSERIKQRNKDSRPYHGGYDYSAR